MSSLLLTESVTVELGADDPWPEDVMLYQPLEDQMLLSDISHCQAVKSFLRMCHLAFSVKQCANAEFMSPSGQVPFIRVGAYVLSEMDPIVGFVNTKVLTNSNVPDDLELTFEQSAQEGYFTGHRLSERLSNADRADMKAYMALVENVLGCAELYVSWLHNETYKQVSFPRYGSVYPWPLNYFITWRKYSWAKRYLTAKGWNDKCEEEVIDEIDTCCKALSERLGKAQYFFDKPTELDALVFGHLFAILSTTLPFTDLAVTVRRYGNLVSYVQSILDEFFHESHWKPRSILTKRRRVSLDNDEEEDGHGESFA